MNVLRLLVILSLVLQDLLWVPTSHMINPPRYIHHQGGQSLLLAIAISLQSLLDLNYNIDTYPLRRYGK